jgi:hypothetical protein
VQTAATIDARAKRTVSNAAAGSYMILFFVHTVLCGLQLSAGATDPVPMADMSQMAQLVYQLYTHNVKSMRTMYEQHMNEHVRAADEEKAREREERIEAALQQQQVRVFVSTIFFRDELTRAFYSSPQSILAMEAPSTC